MLVLTPRVGEKIVIDSTIVVTVTAVKGDRVRLGVAAPASVPVDRLEIHERRRGESPSGPPSVSRRFEKGTAMRTVRQGDRVQIHFVKHWPDGSVASSGRSPLEVTVGVDPHRLPGPGRDRR